MLDQNKLESLSFADLESLQNTVQSDLVSIKNVDAVKVLTAISEQILTAYTNKFKQLNISTNNATFDFLAFLESNGWVKDMVNYAQLYTKKLLDFLEIYIETNTQTASQILRCETLSGRLIFNNCKLPESQEQAEILFNLFNL